MQTRSLRSLALIGIAAALVSMATGCCQSAQRPKAEHTVDQYLASAELMQARFRECANNPGELRDTPDCINVTAARYQGGMGSISPGTAPMNQSMGSMNN